MPRQFRDVMRSDLDSGTPESINPRSADSAMRAGRIAFDVAIAETDEAQLALLKRLESSRIAANVAAWEDTATGAPSLGINYNPNGETAQQRWPLDHEL